jgi:hypothetical protein
MLTYAEGVPDDEMAQAIHPDDTAITSGSDAAPKKKQHGRRIISAIKSVTKGGVETILGTDRLKAAAGAEHAKNRIGVLRSGNLAPAGPIDFPCRYRGKKGHAYITTTATSPALSWTTEKEDIDPVFSIAIADVAVCLCHPSSFQVTNLEYRKSKKSAGWDGRRNWLWDGRQIGRLLMGC